MIGLRYKEQFLDVDPSASLGFELNNLILSNSDSSKLPGSFSFPFTLPGTAKNRAMLNYPERIDNSKPLIREDEVGVYFQGILIFKGTIKVTNAGADIKVYIIANPTAQLKDIPLNELDLGGIRNIGDAAAVLAHAKDTAENPLDYDYVFFPVVNDRYLTEETSDTKCRMQNFYNVDTQAFEVSADAPALMPFVRVEYLLQQIFAGLDYYFTNNLQVEDELRGLCVYNNYSMYAGALSENIDLRNHVSKTKSATWLRMFMSDFCLGLFYNPFNRNINLTPLRDILKRAPRHDWTSKALHGYTISTGDEAPETFDFKNDGQDAAFTDFFKGATPIIPITGTFNTFYDLIEDPVQSFIDGLYYIVCAGGYYYYVQSVPASPFFFAGALTGPAPEVTGKTYECLLPPLFDFWHRGGIGTVLHADAPVGCMPQCRIGGTVTYTPTGGDEQVLTNDVPDRMMMYRGMQNDSVGDDYPLSCSTPWSAFLNTKIGSYSIRLQDDDGIYNNFWSIWHTMLRNGKNVSISLRLTLADILNFNFEDKVRIQNQDFFVKKLRISLTPNGLAPVEAELVSTI